MGNTLHDKTVLVVGTPEDVASAVLFAMTNTFMTGMTLRVDGGERLI